MQENILSNPYYWFSRTYTPMENLVTGAVATGAVTVSDLTEGMDGRSDSAMRMPDDNGITDTFPFEVPGVFSLITWIKTIPAGEEGILFESPNIKIAAKLSEDIINMEVYGFTVFDCFHNTFEVQSTDWHNFIILIDNNEDRIIMYYNGEEVRNIAIPMSDDPIAQAGEEFTIYSGFAGIAVSENKMIPRLLSAEEALYYYQDCAYRSGNGVMVF